MYTPFRVSSSLRFSLRLAIFFLVSLAVRTPLQAAGEPTVTAVFSQVSKDYVRNKLPDGSFEQESYTFGEGGYKSTTPDNSIDRMKFVDVVKSLALPLAAQGYVPAHDPKKTKLLIMVYWGLTQGPPSQSESMGLTLLQNAQQDLEMAMGMQDKIMIQQAKQQIASAARVIESENDVRDRTNFENAKLLGYVGEIRAAEKFYQTPLQSKWDELMEEISESRYFVVLMAYDFQLLAKEKKRKLLWETRFSIVQRGNVFDKQLAAMAREAGRLFGKDSQGLQRQPMPEGKVEIGDLKSLGEAPATPEKK